MKKGRSRYCLDHSVYVPARSDNCYRRQAWCEKRLGPRYDLLENPEGVWAIYWAGIDRVREEEFRFKNETDAIMFTLRWVQ